MLKGASLTEKLELKSIVTFEVKDAEKGDVEAIIATLGVVDKDEDIIRKDAIPDGSKVSMSSYGHDAMFGDAPVGKGTIHVDGNKAVFTGRMFLATQRGRETFETLKEMGSDQQWSFGFRILGAEVPSEAEKRQGARRILTKLDAFEVSPVIVGAGVGTRTLAVKALDETPAPPDPAIEAARLEEARLAQQALALQTINAGAERLFRRAAVR
jgi:phage head maturation protease